MSSPNTPGLRDLQSIETLRPIAEITLEAGRKAAKRDIPVFVKIAPDLADEDVAAVAQMTKELGLEGIVAANTTINHDEGPGGVSGPRLKQRTLNIVKQLRSLLDEDQTIIAVGGISTVEDALEYLNAGADLLEAFTAFIYEGPAWPGKINRESPSALNHRFRPAVSTKDAQFRLRNFAFWLPLRLGVASCKRYANSSKV